MRTLVPALIAVVLACPARAGGDESLRVLVWNVLRGGNEVERGPEKALEVIREADVDLVLLQESYDIDGERPTLGRWLAAELSEGEQRVRWRAHQGESPHLCVLTRLDIEAEFFHHPWHGVGAQLRDGEGREFVAYTIWLDYRSYITRHLRDHPDISDEELVKTETELSGRLAQAEALLGHLGEQGFMEAGVPVLVGGDFNTPSHLDWTVDTARVFKRRRAMDLPVSGAFAAAGFVDAFRQVHPNPVQRPGLTWSPMFRVAGDGKAQGFERIDRLYVLNPRGEEVGGGGERAGRSLRAVSAQVLPKDWEDDAIPAAEREFPSDHGAVLVELVWE